MRCAISHSPGQGTSPAARRYDYLRPGSLDELWAMKREMPTACVVAGGTDLMVRIHMRTEQPPVLISLRGIKELRGINLGATARIGACTTVSELVEHTGLATRFKVLHAAARVIGSAQIRNVATVAGNICNASPCADTAPPLLVLEARIGIAGPQGTREVGVEELFVGPGQTCLGPDEIVTHLLLPATDVAARGRYDKKRRVAMDLAIASVAVQLQMDSGRCARLRVAAGSVAPTPIRLRPVEEALEGQVLSAELLTKAQELAAGCVQPIDDLRASASYRRHIVGVYVRRALEVLSNGGAA